MKAKAVMEITVRALTVAKAKVKVVGIKGPMVETSMVAVQRSSEAHGVTIGKDSKFVVCHWSSLGTSKRRSKPP